ncbi:MAG TPA: DUF4388 domain-containing protein [Vicinamibacteria bacterium]|nr:DUF4388 domain-containing protein [Vicinamibacteria bacterium]
MASQDKRPTQLVDMAKVLSIAQVERLTLHQVSGPGGPRTIRVPPFGEVVLGRDDTSGLLLDEEAASRRHAKVHYFDYKPELLDLGSTNGTFLNGKRVHRAFLKNGDRIQVGTSIFEVSSARAGTGSARATVPAPRTSESVDHAATNGNGGTNQTSALSGSLSEIRLTSLLQVIETDRGTGTLVIRQAAQEGKVHLLQGQVCHATLGRARGVKALYRLMALEDGRFEFFVPGRSPEYETVSGDLKEHLLEGMRQKDELAKHRGELPRNGTPLVFHPSKVLLPARVPPAAFEVMAAAAQYKSVDKIIEFCPLADFEICQTLVLLLKHGVLTIPEGEKSPIDGGG